MKDYKLADLLDMAAIQKMAESHYLATGMPMGIIDGFDNSILVGVGWQDICVNFHRATPESLKKCHASDNYIKQNLRIGEACRYKCKNGLWDIGIPIVVRGSHLATMFIGQFFYEGETPEKDFFIEQAMRFGFDLDAYLEALERVPVFTNEKVEYILKYDNALVTFLIDLAEQSLYRKEAEDELKKARNYIANIINAMPSIIVGVDKDGLITQWNSKAEKKAGIDVKNAFGLPLTRVFPLLAAKMDNAKASLKKREVWIDSKKPYAEEGKIRFEDVTIFPLTDNGIEGAVIVVDDVTERVRLEEMMIQNEKMLSVAGLAAGMAHEINNPLAGILQNASVLENRLLGELPANIKAAEAAGTTTEAIRQYLDARKLPSMLENIRDSASRAAAIVKNMLSFVRKSDRVVSSHDLGALLDKTVELAQTDYDIKKHYDFKQIRIVREYAQALPPVPCEASKIQQVFLNIIKNGAEAMAEKTNAGNPPAFILRVKDNGPWVRVEIEDNGPGMDEATRRRIFEPFFTTKPVGRGTGLGLSVSYFIATEEHGGELSVHPVEGGGTCFVIRLPKAGMDGASVIPA